MADHVSHSDAVKGVYRGLALLAIVTLVEVVVSLFGKGHILGGTGLQNYTWILVIVGIALIALSLYKAYFIVYEFMHMAYEVKGLALSVLLPTLLLVWALIA
ncbi:MAG: cytochrome C oxidase subunit IV family protein, partial [Bacteroidota bacterium]